MSTKHRMAAVILAAIIASPAFAGDDRSWANLGTLKPGDRIGVIQSDRKRIEGRFTGFADSGISVRADRETTVPKESVIRVYRRPRMRRPFRAAIGAAFGLA